MVESLISVRRSIRGLVFRPSEQDYNLSGNRISFKKEEAAPEMTVRVQWGHKLEFMLSFIAFNAGLGNIWRFPYLCNRHGGGPFLIVYAFLQITMGFPLYFMELALGQYSAKGPVNMFDFNPVARGIGLAMCLISFVIVVYYNAITAFIVYYMFASMQNTLPWTVCRPEWKNCISRFNMTRHHPCTLASKPDSNCTCTGNPSVDVKLGFPCLQPARHASEFYFYEVVLKRAPSVYSLDDFGLPSWEMSLCLMFTWVVVTICVVNGVRMAGKIVYFTATVPYVVIAIMLIRGAFYEGGRIGMDFLFTFEWDAFLKRDLWRDAAGQMFYSLGLSMGGLVTLASYTQFYNNILSDAIVGSIMDLLTSILCTFVVFLSLGQLAYLSGQTSLSSMGYADFGLAFVAYPEMLTYFPAQQFWSVLFYFLLFLIGLDSEFTMLETLLTFLEDNFRGLRRNSRKTRTAVGFFFFLLGLPCVCPGGIYLISIMDEYGATNPLISVCAFECVSIMWIYGIGRFLDDLEYMLGRKPCCLPYWYFCWVLWSPAVLVVQMTDKWIHSDEVPKYFSGMEYSPGLRVFGWILYIFIISPIPIWAILYARAVYKNGSFASKKEFFKKLVQPLPRWGPADGTHKLARQRTPVLHDIHAQGSVSEEHDVDSVATDMGRPGLNEEDDRDELLEWGMTPDGKLLPSAAFDRARRKRSLGDSGEQKTSEASSRRPSSSVDLLSLRFFSKSRKSSTGGENSNSNTRKSSSASNPKTSALSKPDSSSGAPSTSAVS